MDANFISFKGANFTCRQLENGKSGSILDGVRGCCQQGSYLGFEMLMLYADVVYALCEVSVFR